MNLQTGEVPSTFTLTVLYEDVDLRILSKPAGLGVLADGTSDWDLSRVYTTHFEERPYLVHRLDKGTSGAMLVARTPDARKALMQAFACHAVRKDYLAWVQGCPTEQEGTIDLPLEKARKGKYRVASPGTGKPSLTEYEVQGSGCGDAVLLCHLLTGRTHQIRVHLAALGVPLKHDPLYGSQRHQPSEKPFVSLFSYRLTFPHPTTGEEVTQVAPLPLWLQELPWLDPACIH